MTLETDVARLAAPRTGHAGPGARDRPAVHRVAGGWSRGAKTTGRPISPFHTAIADASANPIFTQLLTHLDTAFERSAESPFNRAGFGLESFPFHRPLADAVVAGDPDAAETGGHRHSSPRSAGRSRRSSVPARPSDAGGRAPPSAGRTRSSGGLPPIRRSSASGRITTCHPRPSITCRGIRLWHFGRPGRLDPAGRRGRAAGRKYRRDGACRADRPVRADPAPS